MVEDINRKLSMTQEKSDKQQASSARAHWYSPPAPIRRAFEKFPLTTYATNTLPRRAPRDRRKNILHIFTTERVARQGGPSHNPACLKWQAYLKFAGIDFVTAPSNNHASPSGSLPFLLPGKSNTTRPGTPVSALKIIKWTTAQTGQEEEEDVGRTYEAYTSLLDHRIRSAWLYHLYLDPENFRAVAVPLYISTASSNMLVQFALSRQVQQAARDELVKYMSIIDGEELLDGANKAFEALSNLLGDDEFFFGHQQPGLFDASVFAYTHLLVSDQMAWKNTGMKDDLAKYDNLVAHQHRLHADYFLR